LLNPTPPNGYGGTERFVHQLCNNLVDSGHVLHVLCNEGSSGGKYNITRTSSNTLLDKTKGLIKEFNPEIIHINSKQKEILKYLQDINTPVVVTFYNNFRENSSWVGIIENAPKHFHFTAISNSLRERVIEALEYHKISIDPTKILVSGYGMDVSFYTNSIHETPKDYHIYLGVIAQYKSVVDIAKEFTKLNENLLIVGPCNNEDERKYFDEIMKYTKWKNIEYHGETKNEQEKINFLLGAKSLILNTGYDPKESDCHEAFGLVMLEANSLGIPVLGYTQGNIKDYIKDGFNGYKYRKISELGSLIKKLKTSDMKNNCIEHAKNYDIKAIAQGYSKIFEKIISGSKS